jgi:hypothetical protein
MRMILRLRVNAVPVTISPPLQHVLYRVFSVKLRMDRWAISPGNRGRRKRCSARAQLRDSNPVVQVASLFNQLLQHFPRTSSPHS